MFTVKVSQKNGSEEILNFSLDEVRIGRVSSNEIVLPKSNISKRHALLTHSSGGLAVTDTKSTNGTFVNGERISGVCDLNSGDKIYLGEFTVEVVEIAEQSAPFVDPNPSRAETKSRPRLDPTPDADPAILSDDWGASGEISDSWSGDWKSQTPAQLEEASGAVDAMDLASGFPTINPDLEQAHGQVIIPPAPATHTTPVQAPAPYSDGSATGSLVENPHDKHKTGTMENAEHPAESVESFQSNPSVLQIDIRPSGDVFIDEGQGLKPTQLHLGPTQINDTLISLRTQAGPTQTSDGPFIDFTLPNGTRVSGAVPPLVKSTSLILQKQGRAPADLLALTEAGGLCSAAETFLSHCLRTGRSIAIGSSRNGTGATQTLSALLGSIPKEFRTITIGHGPNTCSNVTSINVPVHGEDIEDVVHIALSMNPSYLAVGHAFPDPLDMLLAAPELGVQAILATFNAKSASSALAQLKLRAHQSAMGDETLAASLLSRSVDYLIFQSENPSGQAVVSSIIEIRGGESEEIFATSADGTLHATAYAHAAAAVNELRFQPFTPRTKLPTST